MFLLKEEFKKFTYTEKIPQSKVCLSSFILYFFLSWDSLFSQGAGVAARALRGGGGAAAGLGVAPQRGLAHVHLQPPAALAGLLRVLAVWIRQREQARTWSR